MASPTTRWTGERKVDRIELEGFGSGVHRRRMHGQPDDEQKHERGVNGERDAERAPEPAST